MYNPRPSDLETFSEQELKIAGYTHMPTDYYRNTVMEPEAISTLRPSFGEYEAMGERHEALTSQIDSLNQAMKMSRQRGAFQALQDQMKAVKRLVKEREEIDAQMSVADLARKKTDDHKIAAGLETSYSEQLGSVGDRIAQLETLMLNFAEQSEAAKKA
jgi:DNA repair exonuclease SbcCD ATPase subunit